ncbi:hypothetical protein SBRCBS47491_007747 [Sporothrix bragantina]|uniref:Uncharacterized protein n=1 Tax=Sporothrix bragantina TaxID=671064 RepID=A0ABP0CFR1_9PEZI
MPRYQPESAILKPKDPTAVEDDWPIFMLNDAVVYRPDGVTMANAILVAKEGPCIVRGRLEVDDKEDFQYLVKPSVRIAYIEASNIENYSIGDDEQGVIWLSSSAGWLEINPHPSYEPIYRSMCDMIVLYYILLGIYTKAAEQDPKNAIKLRGTLDVKEMLFEYAVALGDGTTYDETVDKCVRLGPMLLAHFRRATDMDWTKSSFYKWLDKEMRDRERLTRSSSRADSAAPAVPPAAAPSTTVVTPGVTPVPVPQIPPRTLSETPVATSVSHQLPFRAPPGSTPTPGVETPVPLPPHARPGFSTSPTTPATPAAATPESSTATVTNPTASNGAALSTPASSTTVPAHVRASIFNTYLKMIETIGSEFGDPGRMSVGKVHYGVFSKYRVRNYNMGKNLSAYFSRELMDNLSDAWHGSPYETWLTSAEARAFTPTSDSILHQISGQLVRRVAANLASTSSAAANTEPSSRSNSPRTAGKRAVLRPPTISRKRRLDSTENGTGIGFGGGGDDTDAEVASQAITPRPVGRPRKVPRSSQGDGVVSGRAPQAMQVDNADSSSTEDGSDDDDDDDDDDMNDSDEDIKDEAMLAIHTEPLLVSTKPTGPNHTWTCPEPGCDHIVRGLGAGGHGGEEEEEDSDDSDDDSENGTNARIQAHLRGHEEERLSRVDLAISEGTRGRVSVDHLLAKIRTLADKATDRQTPPVAAEVTSSGASTGRSRFFF